LIVDCHAQRPKYSVTVRDMIGDVYALGMISLRIHIKPIVDLYKYHYKTRTLLIYYITCNKST